MPTYVGLLRGVNVGGRNKMPMAQLRAVVASLGTTGVSTYIQSGNIIFTCDEAVGPKSLEAAIETALATTFGMEITVVVRTPAALQRVVEANPFPSADPSALHVGFMTVEPPAASVATLDAGRFLPEQFAIDGTELFLHLPGGMGQSKLAGYLGRQLKVPTTVRNWKTVVKLVELAS